MRCFCIRDLISSNVVQVEYYPAEIMLADFFTKLLQGLLLAKLRDAMLGCKAASSLHPRLITGSKERVEADSS